MNRLILFLIPFFFESITCCFLRSITYLGMDLGGNQAQIGLINTIFIAAQIPLFFMVGKSVNKFGKYTVIYTGILLITLFIFLTSRSESLLTLTITATVGFLGHALFYPPFQALMGDMSSGKKLTKDVGIYNMGWCIGGACAALVQGPIVDYAHNLKGLLYLGMVCGLIDFLLLSINYTILKKHNITLILHFY